MSRGATPTGMAAHERGMSREGRKGGIIAISTSKRKEENYMEVENERRSREKSFQDKFNVTEEEYERKQKAFYTGVPKFRNPRLAAAANGVPPRNFGPSKFTYEDIEKVKQKRIESEKKAKIGMFTALTGKPVPKRTEPLLGDPELFKNELVKKMYTGDPIDFGKPKLPVDRKRYYYLPLLKHPLPLSLHRGAHENILRRVLACRPEKQAMSAVTLRDAWVLEEVYMRGARVDIPDKGGFTPLHIASTLNLYEVLMVLFHIGVDVNVTTLQGNTPLYLAKAAGATQAALLLEERGGKYTVENGRVGPGADILDQDIPYPNPKYGGSVINKQADCIHMPNDHLTY